MYMFTASHYILDARNCICQMLPLHFATGSDYTLSRQKVKDIWGPTVKFFIINDMDILPNQDGESVFYVLSLLFLLLLSSQSFSSDDLVTLLVPQFPE